MDLSLIIPIHNEEGNILNLYNRLQVCLLPLQVRTEYIFINDGSTDSSLHIIKQLAEENPNVLFLDFTRNFGHQVAIAAGIDFCSGNAVVIMDADLQDPPELVPSLYSKLQEGFDVVYARRRKREDELLFKKIAAKIFYRLLSAMTSFPIPLDTGDFRIVNKKIIETLRRMPEREKMHRAQIAWIGMRQSFVEYDRQGRASGLSGYNISKLITLALDGFTSYSNIPLKIATVAGISTLFCSVFFAVIYLVRLFLPFHFLESVSGLFIAVLFLGGIQLLSLGIIGEYLSRIGANVRQRPLYLISETNLKP